MTVRPTALVRPTKPVNIRRAEEGFWSSDGTGVRLRQRPISEKTKLRICIVVNQKRETTLESLPVVRKRNITLKNGYDTKDR